MNQHVAVQACAGIGLCPRAPAAKRQDTIDGGHIAIRQVGTAVDPGTVVAGMALLAQEWHTYLEQRSISRAVRRVAIGTVVNHGTVLPKERSTLLGVTGVTGFVDVVLDQ